MFSDPLSLTVASVSKSLPRINQDGYSSEYRFCDTTQELLLNIRHTTSTPKGSSSKRARHNVEIVQTIFDADPALQITRKVYVVFDIAVGDTNTDIVTALADFLKSTNPAVLTKLVGGES